MVAGMTRCLRAQEAVTTVCYCPRAWARLRPGRGQRLLEQVCRPSPPPPARAALSSCLGPAPGSTRTLRRPHTGPMPEPAGLLPPCPEPRALCTAQGPLAHVLTPPPPHPPPSPGTLSYRPGLPLGQEIAFMLPAQKVLPSLKPAGSPPPPPASAPCRGRLVLSTCFVPGTLPTRGHVSHHDSPERGRGSHRTRPVRKRQNQVEAPDPGLPATLPLGARHPVPDPLGSRRRP